MLVNLRKAIAAAATAAALLLTGCSGSPAADSSAPSSEDGQWPRTITHEAGTTTIDSQPLKIVSTSPSLTGTLLAIGAPVVATAAATPSGLTDDKGFFSQWADVADERGVEVLYSNLELDLDAIDAYAPDLIIGSSNGGDSVLEAYDQLSDIAPTVLVDYGTSAWDDLTTELADATGDEDEAAQVTADFDAWVTEQAELIDLPEQPVTALVYMGGDGAWAFSQDSQQAVLLEQLGFEYAGVPAEYEASSSSGVSVVTAENMPAAFAEAQTLFVVPVSSAEVVQQVASDPLLANQPAVVAGRVHSLGAASFRLDYYSATDTVELLVSEFGR
ncbi:Fe2+-enterobactin ABC transporter substrate-binding protein [Brooklawnia cerclae]|uniref:Iron complex transport system substrate-binding protein n=1 Tax=Brooklawnia cerclae TaxID=349934 RepID=A0ABX0SM39_9ACTN|nr:Fe2+-enterobactin ABC transporter substrate-binding protein [Brooklawnia cerclae]NIH58110.1 iron complex transport system substrate-binding protein [Brooklawnia cerclae]